MASSFAMKQSRTDLNLSVRTTRKQEFLAQMECVVPWAALVELIAPYYFEGKNGRSPFVLETMLRMHFMQQWCNLSDPAMRACPSPSARTVARREHHPALSPPSGKAQAGRSDPGYCQRTLSHCPGPPSQGRYGSRRHTYSCLQLHQEQRQSQRPRDAFKL